MPAGRMNDKGDGHARRSVSPGAAVARVCKREQKAGICVHRCSTGTEAMAARRSPTGLAQHRLFVAVLGAAPLISVSFRPAPVVLSACRRRSSLCTKRPQNVRADVAA